MDVVGAQSKRWGPEATRRRRIFRTVLAAAAASGLISLILSYGIGVVAVSSGSMLPTLRPRDWVLVNRFLYLLRPPTRGDIILFRFSQVNGREFIKRIIGLPGDVVDERHGEFWVNGIPLHGPTVPHLEASLVPVVDTGARRVPAHRVFVLGDNREASLDSRFWGTVDERQILGKALMICWSRGTHWWDVRWGRVGRWLH